MLDFLEELAEYGGTKGKIISLLISIVCLIISFFKLINSPFDFAFVAIILCGLPIIIEALVGLIKHFDITADVLVAIAIVASIFIGETFAAGEVAVIMTLGELLEELSVEKARKDIDKLVKLTPTTARIIVDGKEKIIDAKDVKNGDVLKVLPGESIPVDGIIIDGETSINESVMTGEFLPVDKKVDDIVMSGTINQFGSIEMRATKVGSDSSIQKMIQLVESADARKSEIVSIADKWAVWIVVLAVAISILTYIFTKDIIRAVTVLVVFCPCALVLATPTAIVAAMSNATKHNFLIKEGDALERLSKVSTITFDKTGTLTCGNLKVKDIYMIDENFDKDEAYKLVAFAESKSEHPIGKAIVKNYKENHSIENASIKNWSMKLGEGISCEIDGKQILVGSEKYLNSNDINVDDVKKIEKYFTNENLDNSSIKVFLATDKKLVTCIILDDELRENAPDIIKELKSLDVKPVLLTGDKENVAKKIAENVLIDEVHSELKPEDKLNYITNSTENICMIGDGVNDAPALKSAYVGIAMGGIGSDIATDAADIVLINDDIKELPYLVRLSRKMMKKIKYNLAFSMVLNFVAIALAITGILNPVAGALVHNAGSIFVIINSILINKN